MTNEEFFKVSGVGQPQAEFEFHAGIKVRGKERHWRFDFAWPSDKLALEVEGGIHSGGRHTSAKGFKSDMEKYNRAACLGWRILRVTPTGFHSLGTAAMLKEALKL